MESIKNNYIYMQNFGR